MNDTYFDNRELSWLKFNQRVLEEAEDSRVPLFERLRFISIFSSNLDEFFMVRVGSLYDRTLIKREREKPDNKTHLTPQQQLTRISAKVAELLPRFEAVYWQIMDQIKIYGAEHVRADKLDEADKSYLLKYFVSNINPLLFPTIVDKKHPIPFFANRATYVLARLKSKKGNEYFGIIPTRSEVFSRIVKLPGEDFRFLLMEDLITMFAQQAFPEYEILDRGAVRITRNADIDANDALDDDVDFRDVMEELIKKRRRLCPVRVEYSGYRDREALASFMGQIGLSLGNGFLYRMKCPLDFGFLPTLEDQLSMQKCLFYDRLVPQPSAMVRADEPMLRQIDRGDILLSYPYEAFSPFIRLLDEAAQDRDVVSIKITLYRVARDSKIVDALIKASENGKEVLALVELRARFDEENNIGWSKRLEEAGVQVIYGLDGLKVHSKLLQITRRIGNSIAYTTQIGTGNYNERTSRLYTDLTLMTADHEIGTDVSLVFTALSIGS
ncbi:MAG: polyphosphate kinase 1, partial [Eubacterium sp.]|nr:polyphosphate kinase 1 [Eubacterium sp.]